MIQMPRITLELQEMRHSIVHALMSRNEEIAKYVDSELARIIENFDWTPVVQTTITEAIQKAVKDYFVCGNGKKFLEETINEAFDKHFNPDKEAP